MKKLEKLQSAPAPGPVDAYETVLAAETRKWTEVTRGLNIIMD
ncbi:MAG TPA: hypothetical protein VLK85_15355 [Ramlibacter sp.]|nr:hypothetical protein [Ramlibacter sp.]